MAVLDWTFYGNTLRVWLTALLVAGVLFAAFEIVKSALLRRLTGLAGRTDPGFDDLLGAVVSATRAPWLALFAMDAGSRLLYLPADVEGRLRAVAMIALCIQGALWGVAALNAMLGRFSERRIAGDPSSATTLGLLGFAGRAAIWVLFTLLALTNLDIEVTPLLTGLGIGGVAVALAVQNVLGDVFASLSIVLDRPFAVGDFIVVDNLSGTVEYVGLKTTRVRSPSGEQIVFANGDLLRSRIRNYKRMIERRVEFTVGVTYGTPYEQVARIPEIIREVVEAQEAARFERAHLHRLGPTSLDIDVVYYVRTPDFGTYMDVQQAINLALLRRFGEEGIEFAAPGHKTGPRTAGAGLPAGGS